MKYILLLPALLATVAAAQAQVKGLPAASDYADGPGTTARNTGFGLKGGLSYSTLQGSGTSIFSDRDQLKTFHAGVYGQYGFTRFASLQVEVLYSRKGFRSVVAGSQQANRLDYVAVPVLFVANLTETLSLHLGPQVAVLASARSGEVDLAVGQSGYHRFDFGGVAGAEARLGPARLGVRYDLSLAPLYKDGATLTYNGQPLSSLVSDPDIRNSVLQVYLGLGFAH